jgi:hypothetical protein
MRGNHCSLDPLTVNKTVRTKYLNVQYKSGIILPDKNNHIIPSPATMEMG